MNLTTDKRFEHVDMSLRGLDAKQLQTERD
jgi:hypothetical protein